MIDWDRLVVESEHNGVVASAGEVALLVGADAVGVNWGNIAGDITQQADLMLELDSKIGTDSPVFTGTPRTPTPPAGNNSTRIASTAYVQGELQGSLTGKAPINSPAFTGTPTAPTPTAGDNSTKIATTAFVQDAVESAYEPPADIYVDASHGNDSTGDGSVSKPYKTIGKAITMASDIYLTTIMIAGGTYNETVKVENKSVWLYSTDSAQIFTLLAENGDVELFGTFYFDKINAAYRSKITYRAGTNKSLHIVSTEGNAICAESGSTINIASNVYMDNSISTSSNTVFATKTGGTITAKGVDAGGNSQVQVGKLFSADNGIIICGTIGLRLQYDVEKELLNGGFTGTFGKLAYHDSVNYQTEVTDKPAFGALAMKNVANYDDDIVGKPTLGDLAFENEPPYVQYPDDHMGHISRYVRRVNSQGKGSWVELDEAPSEYDTHGESCYVRTSYANVSPIDGSLSLMHGWKNIDPPLNRQETPKYYVRSNDSIYGHPNGQWYEIWYAIDAPSDGYAYARRNGEWVRIPY